MRRLLPVSFRGYQGGRTRLYSAPYMGCGTGVRQGLQSAGYRPSEAPAPQKGSRACEDYWVAWYLEGWFPYWPCQPHRS